MFFCKRSYSRYLCTEDKSIKALFFELNLHKEMSCDSVLRIIILSADFKVNINDHCVEFFLCATYIGLEVLLKIQPVAIYPENPPN